MVIQWKINEHKRVKQGSTEDPYVLQGPRKIANVMYIVNIYRTFTEH